MAEVRGNRLPAYACFWLHNFDDTVGPPPVSTANLVFFVWVFCLDPGPVPCFASLLFLLRETQIWPGDLCVVDFGGLWCCFWLMIC